MKDTLRNTFFQIDIVSRIDSEVSVSRDPEIVYVMEGIIDVYKGDSEWILHENEYLAINSEEKKQYIIKEPGLFAVIRLKYSEVTDYLGLRSYDILCHSMQEGGGKQGRIGRLIQSVIGYYLSDELSDEAKLFAEMYNLLHQIKGFCMVRRAAGSGKAYDDSEKRLDMIRQFINENYDHKVTLTDLANETYLSTAYLSRYIKEKFGKTFFEVLTDVRLAHAEKDITETDWPITRIALECGFPLPASFNKAFRQKYGMPPSAYRKEHRNKAEAPEQNEKWVGPDDQTDQRIQDYINKTRHQLAVSGGNIAELEAHVRERKDFNRFWEGMINGGTFRDLMRADMQEHLLLLWEGLHFTHVRIWDLYSPELMLFRDDPNGRLNFSRIDGVMDFLHNYKIRPYIELGAKPVILLRNINDYLRYEERKSIFPTPEKFADFLEQFIIHYVNRYGIEEVEQWYFELWMDSRAEDVDHYLNVFDEVYARIKSISTGIRVGGPGLSEESQIRLPELLEGWEKRVNKPDFISIYSYPYVPPVEHVQQAAGVSERIQSSNYVNRMLDENRRNLFDYGFYKQELHLSEWNFSVSNRNIVNDSVFKGAYVVKNLLAMIGKVDMAGYWFGTDLFSEFYDSEHLLNGSGGLITKDMICKPAYYGMYFFSRLDKYLLTYNEDGILTTNGRGNYTIACHNYKHPSYQYYREKEGSIGAAHYKEYFDDDIKQIKITLKGVENGVYQIKTRVVDDENGSVLDEWEHMGYTDELTANDIDYLRKICVPRIKVDVIKIENEVLEISSQLKPNAIAFIHIYHLMKNDD